MQQDSNPNGTGRAWRLAGSALMLALAATATANSAFAREAQPARLEAIGLNADERSASLTLSLSAPVPQHVFRLHDPERLIVDLPATQRHARLPLPPSIGPVVALRSGVQGKQTLRLVVQLRGPTSTRWQPSFEAAHYQLQIMFGNERTRPAPMPHPVTIAVAAVQTPPPVPDASRLVRAAHAPQGERQIIVAVDAGHGGDDPGATGQSGTHEKDVTLAIARALAERIDREPGMRAALTRNGDYFVALPNRIARARALHADMFVSIHADAVRDRDVSGASVYILSERGASSEAAKLLADQENAADLKGGISLAEQRPDVRSVLLNLSQAAAIGQSVEAADRVLSALDRVGAVRKREVQQAAFVVLKSPDIPSMLVETAYISNPLEERKLRTPLEQERLADAIFSGIDNYFRKFPPEGSLYVHAAGERVASDSDPSRGGF
jgi:N-acetylmuramoyl-L-alanine amidase